MPTSLSLLSVSICFALSGDKNIQEVEQQKFGSFYRDLDWKGERDASKLAINQGNGELKIFLITSGMNT
jgi:hypothetical protein